jgi:hypothetical protein
MFGQLEEKKIILTKSMVQAYAALYIFRSCLLKNILKSIVHLRYRTCTKPALNFSNPGKYGERIVTCMPS